MVRAIFFDFCNTLVGFSPPREELHAAACQELGLPVSPSQLHLSLPVADEFYQRESLRLPIHQRPPEEQQAFYTQYELLVLKGAGLAPAPEVAYQVFRRVRERGWKLHLYEDSVPVVTELRGQGLVVGVVSNVDRDIRPYCRQLGVEDLFHFIVTSHEVGVPKPDPAIFRHALSLAGTQPEETMHVGDQYSLDVVGARNAGIRGLLLDRQDLFPQFTDCPRLKTLWEVKEHL